MTDSKTARPSSKRMSIAPPTPRAPSTIATSATIANHALLSGTSQITIGAHAVLHPYARVLSHAGPVEIGEAVVVWERAVVGVGPGDEDEEEVEARFVLVERDCVIESGALVAAKMVGRGTVVEAFARVGEGCVIGKVSFPTRFGHNLGGGGFLVVVVVAAEDWDRAD